METRQATNGVVRIGRKGRKKFAFGEDGSPFEVDVVTAFQQWIGIDNEFRERSEDRTILVQDMPVYHQAAVEFVKQLSSTEVTTAEALDFIARLHEQYEEVATFFRPRSRDERDSPGSSEAELRFSPEES